MKKYITKFWGVGLVIVLLSSLFLAAAPTSGAEPLRWEFHTGQPGGALWALIPSSNITSYAVAADDSIMYAAVQATTGTFMAQGTFGGAMWTDITARLPGFSGGPPTTEALDIDTVDLVAIAPDDNNVVVAVDASADASNEAGVAISVNGGASFSSMNFDGTANTSITGVTISPLITGGIRYVAIYGQDGLTNDAVIYYYNYGAGVGSWKNAVEDFTAKPAAENTMDNIESVAFSSNFPSDTMAVAISEETGTDSLTGYLRLHILQFNSGGSWDATIDSGYPVEIATLAAAFTVEAADVALHPEYDGADDALRIAFVGAAINNGASTELGGVWRCLDYNTPVKLHGSTIAGAGIAVNSVAFDGANLAAGYYNTNNVYRCADPMSNAPSFFSDRSLKRIGVDMASTPDKVDINFVGETLYGSKVGDASAMSKSLDYGLTWNDYTLMDSGAPAAFVGDAAMCPYINGGTVSDIYMTATGDPWYLAASDGGETSIYRVNAPFFVTRILCVEDDSADIELAGLPDDPNVLYAYVNGGTDIYYTDNGGASRWYKRSNAPASISALAVESAKVIYIANGVNVFKSVTSGFNWELPVNTKLGSGGNVYSIVSLGENQLMVGGSSGGICYSTDGGTSWTKTFASMSLSGNVFPQATGLDTGDFLFGIGNASTDVYRAELGPANPMIEFKSMGFGAYTADDAVTGVTGLILTEGVLYTSTCNGTATWIDRTLAPTIPGTHSAPYWSTRYPASGTEAYVLDRTPYPFRTHTAGSSIVITANSGGGYVFYIDDAVALSGPAVTAPANDTLVDINAVRGIPYAVNFLWNRISKATAYELWLSLDAAFTSLVNIDTATGATGDGDPFLEVASSTGTVSAILPGGTFQPGATYYWMVRATTPFTSGMSEVNSFTIAPGAAAVPTIASPLNGASIDNTAPAFSWSPVSQADMYEFQLAADTGFASPLVSEQLANTGIQPAVTLDRGVTYFWRVRAIAPVVGDWSTISNFTVAKEAAAPTPPVVIETVPPPVIEIPPAPPANIIEIPSAPAPEQIAPAYIWAIIIIGAVLVIAVIVLIVRTRRSV